MLSVFAVPGEFGRRKNDEIPKTTEKRPSYRRDHEFKETSDFSRELTRINIHAHPGLPPIPSIFKIAAARRPENADAKAYVENITAILRVS